MKKLRFIKRFQALIKDGTKTQTIRCWKKPQVTAGDLCRSDGIGVLEIVSIDRIELNSLSEGDAKREGFKTVKELLSAIRKIYGKGREGYGFYRIRFRLLPTSDIPLSSCELKKER
jgi:hypothetical protein